MGMMFTAWNHALGYTDIEIEVPYDRSAGVAIVGTILSEAWEELAHGARILTETRNGVSMSTTNGWTISRTRRS